MLNRLYSIGGLALTLAFGGQATAERVPFSGGDIVPPTEEWLALVEKAAPPEATVAAPRRQVLVFSRFTGFDHKVIPHVDKVFEILGEKSGAFETTVTLDIEALTPERLARYDVLVLNNNCSVGPRRNLFLDALERDPQYAGWSEEKRQAKSDALEQSLLDFVAGGRGLVVMHGAPTLLNNSKRFTEMVGGAFDYHPPSQEVTVRVVDENHPLVAAFKGKGAFIHRDEPYCFNGAYEQFDFRPLLAMEVEGLNDPAGRADDLVRYVAWIRPHGEGRVFYCSPSHYPDSYTSPTLLRFVLGGVQYAAGDLVCDDSTPGKESGDKRTDAVGLPPLIPLRDFFKNPVETGHRLSPSGDFIAYLKPWESRMNVYVRPVGSANERRITEVTERDIADFAWATEDRLIYSQDQGGDENFHLYAVNRRGGGVRDLTPYEETRASIENILPHDPEHILISHNRRDKQVFDLYRLNTSDWSSEMVVENPGNITSYLPDHDGRVRVATTADGVNTSLLYRDTEADDFQNILTVNFRNSLEPLAFTYDNRFLYCASNLGRDKAAIAIFDPQTTNEVEAIYEHPQVDVWELLRSDKREKITGVTFVAAKRAYHFLDEERAGIQAFLEARLPGLEVVLSDENLAEDRFLVTTFSDRTRGSVYFYDHRTQELTHVADRSPWLDSGQMASVRPIVYQSRDGLLINGYLTLPRGVPAKRLPTVILPHGGPWARDNWGFSPTLQFLANRGYAVLQMNFRGSTGYGRRFWELSFREWGLSMQDDVTDGVEWLIDQGIADPDRIGIYGGSYGGYVVLAGLTTTPDLYACGADYVGVANLFTILASIPPYWEPMRIMMYEMMGDPEQDKELMRAASPVFNAGQIKVPLLIAQGARDPRVKKDESDQMVAALKERGIDVPYLVKENEGHGFRNEENRFEFYRALEQFFGRHLGGRVGGGEDVLGGL